jgi:hypothetical protein
VAVDDVPELSLAWSSVLSLSHDMTIKEEKSKLAAVMILSFRFFILVRLKVSSFKMFFYLYALNTK